MTKPVLILGAGGHAKVLVEALLQSGVMITGITDPDPSLAGTNILGVPVLGDDHLVHNCQTSDIFLVNGLGSVGLPTRRKELFEHFQKSGYTFANVIHPSTIIASDAILGEGTQIMAGSVIQPGCRIGFNSIVNTRVSVDHDCLIGNHVHIAPGVTLSGDVQIGDCVHIGTGASMIQGISIGNNSLIAAGAVVISHVIAMTKVRGVPAMEFV